MSDATVQMVLEPEDEYPHEPDDSPNDNVGMSEYPDQVVDGWPTGPDLPTKEVSS